MSKFALLLSCSMFAFTAAGVSRAAEPEPLSRAELDKRAKMTARDTIELGRNLFNAGNHEGCYRLYEGSLGVLKSVFDHRPALVKTIDAQFAKFIDNYGNASPLIVSEQMSNQRSFTTTQESSNHGNGNFFCHVNSKLCASHRREYCNSVGILTDKFRIELIYSCGTLAFPCYLYWRLPSRTECEDSSEY